MHRITDPRWQGSAVRNLELFQKICGDLAFKNVVLLTSRWEEITDEALGIERESQYREEKWRSMIEKGSTMIRFYGTEQSAFGMASYLFQKSNVMLEIQKEIVVEHKLLDETSAGSLVNSSL